MQRCICSFVFVTLIICLSIIAIPFGTAYASDAQEDKASRDHFALENEHKQKDWSVLIYSAGGDDVSNEARESLLRMKQIGSTNNIHVVAQLDPGSEGASTRRYYLSPDADAMSIESILSQACNEVRKNDKPLDAIAGTYYSQRLKDILSKNAPKELQERIDRMLQTEDMVRLIQYDPDRFKNLILNLELEPDRHPTEGNLGDTNAGDPKTLSDFIEWAKTKYPAKHSIVVLWGHGNGFTVAMDSPAIPYPDKKDALTVEEIREAFLQSNGTETKKENSKYKIDIVGFNSCSQGTIELYRQLKGLAHYGIASEGFTPKTSWPYDRILKALNNNSKMEPKEFAERIVAEYVGYYEGAVKDAEELHRLNRQIALMNGRPQVFKDVQELYSNKGPDLVLKKASVDLWGHKTTVDLEGHKTTVDLEGHKTSVDLAPSAEEKTRRGIDLSACDLNASDQVAVSLGKLVDLLLNSLQASDTEVFGAIVGAHALSQSYFNKDFVDLYDFSRALGSFNAAGPKIKIRKASEAVMSAVKGMCSDSKHAGEDVRNSHGVSIFFPWNEYEEKGIYVKHQALPFMAETRWNEFLRTYRKMAGDLKENRNIFSEP